MTEATTLHIILRAYEGEKHKNAERPMGLSKIQTLKACVRSLGRAVRLADDPVGSIECTLVSDHLSAETYEFVADELPVTHEIGGEFGNDKSLKIAFEEAGFIGEDGTTDFILMAEDDYLWIPVAIKEIISELRAQRDRGQKSTACWIHPSDYPEFYTRDAGIETLLWVGQYVHWRTSRTTTFTFAGEASEFCRLYGEFLPTCRRAMDGDLSAILRAEGGIASPLPSLAAHWQDEATLPSHAPMQPGTRNGWGEKGWEAVMRRYL